jgi:peptidoglycan/xylan/chitin deacetylase (PgdA/CDA1 family)
MEKKYLCLSYDDGPNLTDPQTMTEMLDILEKHKVPASFFIIGNKVTEENKEVIRRAIKMGAIFKITLGHIQIWHKCRPKKLLKNTKNATI